MFADKLKNHTEKVNPKVWSGVQSQIAVAKTAALSVASKVIIGVVSTVLVSAGIYFVTKSDSEIQITSSTQKEVKQNTTAEIQITLEEEQEKQIANLILEDKVDDKIAVNKVVSQQNNEVDNGFSVGADTLSSADLSSRSIVADSLVGKKTDNSISVNEKPSQVEEELPNFSILSSRVEEVYTFSLTTDDFDFIEWNFGDGNYSTDRKASHFYNSTGKYNVTAKIVKGNKQRLVTIEVGKEAIGKISKWPSVVTCNNDGFNDALVLETENLKDFQIIILNSDNELIFKSSDTAFSWNGMDLKGEPVSVGNYVYIITALDIAGNAINKYQMLEVRR